MTLAIKLGLLAIGAWSKYVFQTELPISHETYTTAHFLVVPESVWYIAQKPLHEGSEVLVPVAAAACTNHNRVTSMYFAIKGTDGIRLSRGMLLGTGVLDHRAVVRLLTEKDLRSMKCIEK